MSGSREPARTRASRIFWERNGKKPYGPEFHDSLVNVLRASPNKACLTERVWAWHRWRSWCLSSNTPVSNWHDGYDLDQTDCALDLWWFKQGKSADWVLGAPREHRKQERQRREVQHFKAAVGRAIQVVVSRGDLIFKDGKYYSVMSPPADKAPLAAVAGSSYRFLADKAFLSWRAVARSSNHERFLVARSDYYKERKVARSDYREYLDLATSEKPKSAMDSGVSEVRATNAPAVDPLNPINPKANGASASSGDSSSSSVLAPTTTEDWRGDLAEMPRTREVFRTNPELSAIACVAEALQSDDDAAKTLISRCRANVPDVTPTEIADHVNMKRAQIAGRKRVDNWPGFLLEAVPKMITPAKIAPYRARVNAAAVQDAAALRRMAEREATLQHELQRLEESEAQAEQLIAEMGPEAHMALVLAMVRKIRHDYPKLPFEALQARAEDLVRIELGKEMTGEKP